MRVRFLANSSSFFLGPEVGFLTEFQFGCLAVSSLAFGGNRVWFFASLRLVVW